MKEDQLVSDSDRLNMLREKQADVANRLSGPASLASTVSNITPPPPASTVWGTKRNAALIRAQGDVISATSELVSRTKTLIMAQGDLATVNYDLTQLLEMKKQATMLAKEATREVETMTTSSASKREEQAKAKERQQRLLDLQIAEAEERLREIRIRNAKLEALDPNNPESAIIIKAFQGGEAEGETSIADQVAAMKKANAEAEGIRYDNAKKAEEAKIAGYNAEVSLANAAKTLKEMREED